MSPSGPVRYAGPALADAIRRAIYRLGFPLARLWWQLRGQRHEGALVAVHIDGSLLLVRSSYRTAWNFQAAASGVTTPEAAARRELAEEISIVTQAALSPAGQVCGLWDGRRDRVHAARCIAATAVPQLFPS